MRRRYILYIVVILLSIINIINTNNTSALSYQSSIGVGFTFNPTLSVNISSDLIINNLVPGSSSDSNIINVSVATNASYGYALSAIVNGNNSDLVHTNNSINNSNNVFSSIDINADLSDLDNSEDTNIWGYSYKDNTVVSPTWSNYNGLSSSNSTILLNTNSNNYNVEANSIDSIDFKIGAKAASTQASGTYTGTINFTAVTKPTPMNLAESYFAAGKTRHNGYYAMQDMTSEICNNTEVIGEGSQTELIDLRDDKVYWATKLADGKCWMTQDLDLDLDSSRTYTHWDTDLGWTALDNNAEWKPSTSTATTGGWKYSATAPFSYDPGNKYVYTSNSDADDTEYASLVACETATSDSIGCSHSHLGNYYNWPAAVAENNTSEIAADADMPNSVCPAGWYLPNATSNEYGNMLYEQKIITSSPTSIYYTTNGFINIRKAPLYFVRGNKNGGISGTGTSGSYYISSMSVTAGYPYFLGFSKPAFDNKGISAKGTGSRSYDGFSVRCLAR